jgi:isoleucyl-tRNA synthetase
VLEALQAVGTDLRAVFIVSALDLKPLAQAPADAVRDAELPDLAVSISKAAGEKCERCWIYDKNLGSNSDYPGLCPRCTAVLQAGN